MKTAPAPTRISPVETRTARATAARSAARTFAAAAALASLAVLPDAALAQTAPSNAVTSSAAITGLGTFNTNLDSNGGSFNWSGVIVTGTLSRQINEQWSVGFNLGYQYEHWSFSNPSAFGNEAPWGSINRPNLGFNVGYAISPQTRVFVAPQFEWDYETGANAKAQNFGAVAGITHVFSRGLILGIGAGVFHQINETKVFPFPIVSWQISDNLKLGNPFRAGPAGGAGLELTYSIDDKWDLAGGGTYRDYRFRLQSSGPNADGIGQNQGIPLFARLSRKLGKDLRVDLYGGATVAGTLKLRDSNGNTLVSSDYNAAPFMALTLAADF